MRLEILFDGQKGQKYFLETRGYNVHRSQALYMKRRRILSVLALGVIPSAGCLDSIREVKAPPVEDDDTSRAVTTEEYTDGTTAEPCTKTVPRPDDPYFEDISIKNRTDESKTVEVTVSQNSSEIFQSEYDVPPGALVQETKELFTEQSTYEVTAIVGDKSKSSEPVTPIDDQWRLYNGVRIEVESVDADTEISFLYPHGDKATTPAC